MRQLVGLDDEATTVSWLPIDVTARPNHNRRKARLWRSGVTSASSARP